MSDSKPSSTLPFDPDEVSVVRLNQAQIAELFGVSRQAVNQWVKRGKITPFADGTLDPTRVAKELARNADPRKLRNRIFRRLNEETQELRDEVARLRTELASAQALASTLELQAVGLLREVVARTAWLDRFYEEVEALDTEARSGSPDEWARRLESIYTEADQPTETVTYEDLRRTGLEHYAPLIGHSLPQHEVVAEQLDADIKALLEDLDPDLVAELEALDLDDSQDEEHLA